MNIHIIFQNLRNIHFWPLPGKMGLQVLNWYLCGKYEGAWIKISPILLILFTVFTVLVLVQCEGHRKGGIQIHLACCGLYFLHFFTLLIWECWNVFRWWFQCTTFQGTCCVICKSNVHLLKCNPRCSFIHQNLRTQNPETQMGISNRNFSWPSPLVPTLLQILRI